MQLVPRFVYWKLRGDRANGRIDSSVDTERGV